MLRAARLRPQGHRLQQQPKHLKPLPVRLLRLVLRLQQQPRQVKLLQARPTLLLLRLQLLPRQVRLLPARRLQLALSPQLLSRQLNLLTALLLPKSGQLTQKTQQFLVGYTLRYTMQLRQHNLHKLLVVSSYGVEAGRHR